MWKIFVLFLVLQGYVCQDLDNKLEVIYDINGSWQDIPTELVANVRDSFRAIAKDIRTFCRNFIITSELNVPDFLALIEICDLSLELIDEAYNAVKTFGQNKASHLENVNLIRKISENWKALSDLGTEMLDSKPPQCSGAIREDLLRAQDEAVDDMNGCAVMFASRTHEQEDVVSMVHDLLEEGIAKAKEDIPACFSGYNDPGTCTAATRKFMTQTKELMMEKVSVDPDRIDEYFVNLIQSQGEFDSCLENTITKFVNTAEYIGSSCNFISEEPIYVTPTILRLF